MCVSSASPPNFHECREPSRLMVSATCSRCSRVSRRESDVQFRESGIAQQLGRIKSRFLRQLCGAGEHQSLIIRLIVTGCGGPGGGLRSYKRLSVYETHNRGLAKNVLVESRKEE